MARHGASPEAEKRGHRKFEKERMIQLNLKLNDRTDKDILDFLESVESKRGFALAAMREKIARDNTREK